MKRLLTGLCFACLTAVSALAQNAAQSMPPPASGPQAATQSPGLVGTLQNEEAWRAYKQKFVSEAGRVVDTANGRSATARAKVTDFCSQSLRGIDPPSSGSGVGRAPISRCEMTPSWRGAGSPTIVPRLPI